MRIESGRPEKLVKKELKNSSQIVKTAQKVSAACFQFQSVTRRCRRSPAGRVQNRVIAPARPIAARAMTNYEGRISKIEGDINLLKWMIGFNLAMTVAILFRVFS